MYHVNSTNWGPLCSLQDLGEIKKRKIHTMCQRLTYFTLTYLFVLHKCSLGPAALRKTMHERFHSTGSPSGLEVATWCRSISTLKSSCD